MYRLANLNLCEGSQDIAALTAKEGLEFKRSSKVINYSPVAPPSAPRLRVTATDIQSASLEWVLDAPLTKTASEFFTGYRLVVNNEQRQTFDKSVKEFLFSDMQPGRKYEISLVSLTNSILGNARQSNLITLVCPRRPAPPVISAMQSTRPNSALISWNQVEPRSELPFDQIVCYRVFVNDKYHGEIQSSNMKTLSYMISDLEPAANSRCDVYVQVKTFFFDFI
jgi:hypothetical protein